MKLFNSLILIIAMTITTHPSFAEKIKKNEVRKKVYLVETLQAFIRSTTSDEKTEDVNESSLADNIAEQYKYYETFIDKKNISDIYLHDTLLNNLARNIINESNSYIQKQKYDTTNFEDFVEKDKEENCTKHLMDTFKSENVDPVTEMLTLESAFPNEEKRLEFITNILNN